MKTTHWIYIAVMALVLASCLKDKTNYDLGDGEKITIEGMEKSYSVITGTGNVEIDPRITTSDKQADLEYVWMILPDDTLATTQRLEHRLIKDPGTYSLRLEVKNKRTQYAQYAVSQLNVGTAYTRGWYVAKSTGGKTDIDLHMPLADGSGYTRMDDVFSLNNNRKLEGDPLILSFHGWYYAWNGSEFALTRTLFAVTEQDATAVSINGFKESRSFETLFYEPLKVRKPKFIVNALMGYYTVNDGLLYSYFATSVGNGQFGAPNMIDEKNTPYRLSQYFIGPNLGEGAFFFDEISSSFVEGVSTGGVMIAVKDDPMTQMKATGNNQKLLYMGLKTVIPTTGYAVFADKTDPSQKTLAQIKPSSDSFIIETNPIRPNEKLYQASKYMLLEGDEDLMFFVVGNQVWSRNLSNQAEELQYVAPAGETITLLRHRKYVMESKYAHNYVAVGTVQNGAYKIRMFTKSAGRLAKQPDMILEGTGNYVGDLMYVGDGLRNFFSHNITY